jgi:hypothetical protein
MYLGWQDVLTLVLLIGLAMVALRFLFGWAAKRSAAALKNDGKPERFTIVDHLTPDPALPPSSLLQDNGSSGAEKNASPNGGAGPAKVA